MRMKNYKFSYKLLKKNWFAVFHELIICENKLNWINFTRHRKCNVLFSNWIMITIIQMTKSSLNFRRYFRSWTTFLAIFDNFFISSKFSQKFLTIFEIINRFLYVFRNEIFFSFNEILLTFSRQNCLNFVFVAVFILKMKYVLYRYFRIRWLQ